MNDEYDLQRFVAAQDPVYVDALDILRKGMMCSPYIDFIFPRFEDDLDVPAGGSFVIRSLDEARAYLAYPVLGNRYRECVRALSWLADREVSSVFSATDVKKLHSSLTLFAEASNESVLREMLDIWFDNLADEDTLAQLDLTA
ncbi:DUF1810 family protein [Sphingomonas sp. 22R3R2A-7]|uniref:DUF1810 family protein n=1 Tax=Sphingomonas sp. 22R3R2A-7 TaxID=3050230 RepID=UPI002FE3D054